MSKWTKIVYDSIYFRNLVDYHPVNFVLKPSHRTCSPISSFSSIHCGRGLVLQDVPPFLSDIFICSGCLPSTDSCHKQTLNNG
uniref:Ovule protein n=1 Tax=Caenorhabditis tropicalis TaxID=1561998 RepID=A0A1I7TKM8_9PELO